MIMAGLIKCSTMCIKTMSSNVIIPTFCSMVVAFTTLQKNKNYIVPGEPIYKKKVLSGK